MALMKTLKVLVDKEASEDERKDAYALYNGSVAAEVFDCSSELSVNDMRSLISTANKDALHYKNASTVSEVLQTLIICMNFDNLAEFLDDDKGMDVIGTMCACVRTTEDKVCCLRLLFCISTQKLPDVVIQNKVTDILDALEFAMGKWQGQSTTVENECVNVIRRLNLQARKLIMGDTARWGLLLVPLISHKAIRVRENALAVLISMLETAQKGQQDLVAVLSQPIKQIVLPGLKKLFHEHEQLYVIKCWGTLVQLYGKELHASSQITEFLPVIQLGFKSSDHDVKVAAFQAWQHLIDNFALNPTVLQDPKRIKLIMQVFTFNSTMNEQVALTKLKVWWHFIWLLGNKVTPNFEMVAVPFLQFCLVGKATNKPASSTSKILANGASPRTPHLKLTSPNSGQFPVYKSLQLLGCQALAHILGTSEDGLLMESPVKLDALRHEVISGPSFFIKQSYFFITTATELFCSLGCNVSEHIVMHIWQWLVVHLKNAIDSPVKLDIRESLRSLLQQFQIIVLSQNLQTSIVLKMFREVCSLPKKVLCSTAYSIGGGEMNGTPALFIISLLLSPNLLQSCSAVESYMDLFTTIIASGMSHTSCSLGFLQSVLELVDSNGQCEDNRETLWHLWAAIVDPLEEHIVKTNEVNQGDSLEHNFACCTQALIFPAQHRLDSMSQPCVKTLTKTWSDLYRSINRVSALVTSADANTLCEEVCAKLLHNVKKQATWEGSHVDMLAQMTHVITTSLDFSDLGNQSAFNLTSSPRKWMKKKGRALGNIDSLVLLLGHLQTLALRLVSDTEQSNKPSNVALQGMLNVLVDSFCTLFTHVTSSNVISNLIGQLAQPIADLLTDASKKTSKVFNNAFQQNLETLWADICMCLQGRYTAMFDSNFLCDLSPLLEATFLHSRRQIKNQTLALWASTFAKASSLDYPDTLKPILSRVKVKSSVTLPGFVAMVATSVIEETPISQMTQTQALEPPQLLGIPGMPSPHKMHGSFLNKPVSPSPNMHKSPTALKSPLKTPVSPRQAGLVKKMLSLDGFNDKDFVVIKNPPKKKMVLTDHQKEVMKEKRVLPAMYNSLENSVDASLMAAHFSTDTQMEGSLSETPTPTTSNVPFSLFGKPVPLDNTQESSQVHDDKPKATKGKKGKTKSPKSSPSAKPSDASEGKGKSRSSPKTGDVTKHNDAPETETITAKRKSPNSRPIAPTEPSATNEFQAEAMTTRRSVRIKENDETKEKIDLKKKVKQQSPVNSKRLETSQKSSETDVSKVTVSNDMLDNNSVVVIEDSEPMDVDNEPMEIDDDDESEVFFTRKADNVVEKLVADSNATSKVVDGHQKNPYKNGTDVTHSVEDSTNAVHYTEIREINGDKGAMDNAKPQVRGASENSKTGEAKNNSSNSSRSTRSLRRIDLTTISHNSQPSSAQFASETGDLGGKMSTCSSELMSPLEFPQNLLGAAGYSQMSSLNSKASSVKSSGSKSSESNYSSSGSLQQSGEDGIATEGSIVGKANETKDPELKLTKAADQESHSEAVTCSEPLLSWTQKLNELSQSPSPQSGLRKFSDSLEPAKTLRSAKSPLKSPLKSPRKNYKKKLSTNENIEEKRALDKWLIRSPAKGVDFTDKVGLGIREITVANVSQTLVEETQSPSKFLKKTGGNNRTGDEISPSIMETPPKNVLENLPVNHGNSNRKLFSSQGSNPADLDIIEDSNLIPASPISRSFPRKSATPILKVKKLSETEMKRFSPQGGKPSDDQKITPTEVSTDDKASSLRKVKCTLAAGMDAMDDSSHEHDDFSVFKPLDEAKTMLQEGKNTLEEGTSKDEDFFNKSLTDTEQAMLNLPDDGDNLVVSDTAVLKIDSEAVRVEHNQPKENTEACPESIALFSQDIVGYSNSTTDTLITTRNGVEGSKDTPHEPETTTQTYVPEQENSPGENMTSQSSQSRKRKQITPKKFTPEDKKRKKKKASPQERSSETRSSSRTKNATSKQDCTNETKELKRTKKGAKASLPTENQTTKGNKTEAKEGKQEEAFLVEPTAADGNDKVATKGTFSLKLDGSQEYADEIADTDMQTLEDMLFSEETTVEQEDHAQGDGVAHGDSVLQELSSQDDSLCRDSECVSVNGNPNRRSAKTRSQVKDVTTVKDAAVAGERKKSQEDDGSPGNVKMTDIEENGKGANSQESAIKTNEQYKEPVLNLVEAIEHSNSEVECEQLQSEHEEMEVESLELEASGESSVIVVQDTGHEKRHKNRKKNMKLAKTGEKKDRSQRKTRKDAEDDSSKLDGGECQRGTENDENSQGTRNDVESSSSKYGGSKQGQRNDNGEQEKGRSGTTSSTSETDMQMAVQVDIVGQKTPDNKPSSTKKQPGRRSTTKHKKEIVQQMVGKRSSHKDILINDSDSNLDTEDMPTIAGIKSSPSEGGSIDKKIEHGSDSKNRGTFNKTTADSKNQGKLDNTAADGEGSSVQFTDGAAETERASIKETGKQLNKGVKKTRSRSSAYNTNGTLENGEITSTSESSDDNISISQMAQKLRGAVSKSCEKVKPTVTSPVANKLRSSSARKTTRLRSGEKNRKSTSPQAKRAVNLALKRTRATKRSLLKDASKGGGKEIDEDKVEDVLIVDEKDKVTIVPNSLVSTDSTITQENEVMDSATEMDIDIDKSVLVGETVHENVVEVKDTVPVTINMKDETAKNTLINSTKAATLAECEREHLNENTPRKPTGVGESTAINYTTSSPMTRHSDSKLILASRKFKKRGGVARRSILKTASVGSGDDSGSPIRVADFHPITVNRIYSPTASPSASILKKRRLSDDPTSDTNSPPAKQRRVSFATPLIDIDNSLLPGAIPRPSSPLVTQQDDVKDSTSSMTTTILTPLSSGKPGETQSTQGSPTQRNYESTQESQLNPTEPVYPDLTWCNASVEKVLPQLTSSIWSRGLGQLVRARNIHTIGDLSALTETDIHSLPIRSPKVDTVRKVLNKFGQNLHTSKAKLWNSPKVRTGTQAKSDRDIEADEVEAILSSSGDLLSEVNRLSSQSKSSKQSHDSTVNQSGNQQLSHDNTVDQPASSVSELTNENAANQCVQDLDNSDKLSEMGKQPMEIKAVLSQFSDRLSQNVFHNKVSNLKNNELVDVNQMLTDIQSNVVEMQSMIVNELRNRCSSSPRT